MNYCSKYFMSKKRAAWVTELTFPFKKYKKIGISMNCETSILVFDRMMLLYF